MLAIKYSCENQHEIETGKLSAFQEMSLSGNRVRKIKLEFLTTDNILELSKIDSKKKNPV